MPVLNPSVATLSPAMLLAVIALPALFAPVMLLCGKKMGPKVGFMAMLAPLISLILLALIVSGWSGGDQKIVSFEWIPSLGVELSFLIDGLSIFYGFIICGVGVLVCWYAAAYFSEKQQSLGWFFACLLVFMSAMLGAVFSNNLLLLFVFWELTGIASFLLIGFKHYDEAARLGARRALMVTVATGLCMMAGIILLGLVGGTYDLSVLINRGDALWIDQGPLISLIAILILLGAFGKSAQFPFHFWLPGAMAAPTPVSAYLHSATMVKLGVFLTARIFPLFSSWEFWLPVVAGVGIFTMLWGAFLALKSNDLKAILAYSTVSQLGFLIGYYGLSGREGVHFDFVHVISHVFYKGALFMVAGIVDHATGIRDIRQLGGLGKRMPYVAGAALVATAALAGVPLTTGFISKEIMLERLGDVSSVSPWGGGILYGMVVLSAIFTVAFALRFFRGVFMGEKPAELAFHAPTWKLQLPPLILAFGAIFFGAFPQVMGAILNRLQVNELHAVETSSLAIWHGFNFELLASTFIFIIGGILYVYAQRSHWSWADIPKALRFDQPFDRTIDGLSGFSKKVTLALRSDWPPAYLPIVICFLLVTLFWAAITNITSLDSFISPDWTINPLRAFVALLITVGLVAVLVLRRWTAQLVALSVSGFFLTFYFVLYQAPDLAMTQILVESASVVMILVLVSRFSTASRAGTRFEFVFKWPQIIRAVLALGMGVLMTGLVLYADMHRHSELVGVRMRELSQPLAEGTNAVNTILVDFRAFDTMGEITVLLIAALGGIGLMMRYKQTKQGASTPPGFLQGRGRRHEES